MSASSPLSFSQAIATVKGGLDIVAIVGRYVPLKKAGRNYLGLCPFHNEKSPSFNVNAERQLFKCFGCGESGDAFAFLMKVTHQDFKTVVKDCAETMGISIAEPYGGQSSLSPEALAQQKARNKNLLQLNAAAAAQYHRQLFQAPAVLDYCSQRGLSEPLLKHFQLGYATPGWHSLRDVLKAQAHADELLASGLFVLKPDQPETLDNAYDRFRDRLMFPVWNLAGEVIGFGGRVLDAAQQPKYLNSSETVLYHKSMVLYAQHLAKTTIAQNKRAVVVEGYMDVIRAHACGLTETVGACGTALTVEHFQLLSRLGAQHVILFLDADSAGRQATLRAIDTFKTWQQKRAGGAISTMRLTVFRLPEGESNHKDPDDWLKASGEHAVTAFEALLATAPEAFTFQLNCVLAGIPQADHLARTAQAVALIRSLAYSPVQQYQLLRQAATQLDIPETVLWQECLSRMPATAAPKPLPKPSAKHQIIPRHLQAETRLLQLMLQSVALLQEAQVLLAQPPYAALQLTRPEHQYLFERLTGLAAETLGSDAAISELIHGWINQQPDEVQKPLLSALAEALIDQTTSEALSLSQQSATLRPKALLDLLLAHHQKNQLLTMAHDATATDSQAAFKQLLQNRQQNK